MKKILLAALLLLLTACTNRASTDEFSTPNPEATESAASFESSTESLTPDSEGLESTSEEQTPQPPSTPTTNAELYALFMKEWKTGSMISMFPYASDTIKSLMNVDEFQFMLCDPLYHATGFFVDVQNEETIKSGSTEIYKGTLIFVDDMAEMDFELSLSEVQIIGYYYDLRFKESRLMSDRDNNGIITNYFLMESGDYLLNAAYVSAPSENAPVALFIPGSGPSDYNETIGMLPTFQDLALKLANKGISSLRMEKRTNRYASSLESTIGLEEEYFQDWETALAWLDKKNLSDNLWLLGHSLGVNVAAELAERHPVNGLILWNGSARHLADIAADQYGAAAPAVSALYQQMAENAKAVTKETADGSNYFTCSDYYWASYNELDTVASIKRAKLPTLILNSLLDRQLFDADRELWQQELGNVDFVKIRVFDDMSHFGYKIDASEGYYHLAEFPDELIDEIADFINR